mmetsp:Transcript_40633/g.94871  ORF Transcript_40633/g.94871 Transcript_40633/m.94871 type:complete len:255 (-) Transcript_40633:232-996(-)
MAVEDDALAHQRSVRRRQQLDHRVFVVGGGQHHRLRKHASHIRGLEVAKQHGTPVGERFGRHEVDQPRDHRARRLLADVHLLDEELLRVRVAISAEDQPDADIQFGDVRLPRLRRRRNRGGLLLLLLLLRFGLLRSRGRLSIPSLRRHNTTNARRCCLLRRADKRSQRSNSRKRVGRVVVKCDELAAKFSRRRELHDRVLHHVIPAAHTAQSPLVRVVKSSKRSVERKMACQVGDAWPLAPEEHLRLEHGVQHS